MLFLFHCTAALGQFLSSDRDTLAEGGRDVHKKKRDLRRANVGVGFEEEKAGVVLGCTVLIPLYSEFLANPQGNSLSSSTHSKHSVRL